MKTSLLSIAFVLLVVTAPTFADTFGSGSNQLTIDFATIGNPGNPADTACDPGCPNPNPAGSVPYVYRMGKYEISRDMVEKANSEGNLGIPLADMSFVTGGTRPDMPATGVSWNEAARFVNYLNTSQGFPVAYKFTTKPGDAGYDHNANINLWEPSDPGYDEKNRFRNSLAHYFLPSVHEWYKAAYYDPNANGGVGGYWDFPTGANSVPTPVASGTDPGTAVWKQSFYQGPADITEAGGPSPYGTMAQAGNVWEWEETEYDLVNDAGSSGRGLRGNEWRFSSYSDMSAWIRGYFNPTLEYGSFGFRVAGIPEPCSASLGALSMIGLLLWRRRAG